MERERERPHVQTLVSPQTGVREEASPQFDLFLLVIKNVEQLPPKPSYFLKPLPARGSTGHRGVIYTLDITGQDAGSQEPGRTADRQPEVSKKVRV